MVFSETNVPEMTLVFLLIVAALTAALVGLFVVLERSESLTRWRHTVMLRAGVPDSKLRKRR